jgi:hypothetical protein
VAQQQFFLTPPTRRGTFTIHVVASTESRVQNGKYIRYDGYITVTATGPSSYWLSAAQPQLAYSSPGSLQSISATVTIMKDPGYSGTPQMTYGASANFCSSTSFMQSSATTFTWTCIPSDPVAHHMYTLNFYGNDGASQQSAYTGIGY